MKKEYIDYLKKYLAKDKFDEGMILLNKGISPQYIVGNVDFYGNIIKVDNRVLIPRFETELLVEKTIGYINKIFDSNIKILDIGTGSGCIAISLKKLIDCDVVACDISNDALNVAKSNALYHNVDIDFVNSDIFSNINCRFDVIISNPPYIGENEKIDDIVKNNEPSIALYASNNGLYFYDKILKECSHYLNNRFLICFEIGRLQGESVRKIANKYLGNDIMVSIEKDYSGNERYLFIYN